MKKPTLQLFFLFTCFLLRSQSWRAEFNNKDFFSDGTLKEKIKSVYTGGNDMDSIDVYGDQSYYILGHFLEWHTYVCGEGISEEETQTISDSLNVSPNPFSKRTSVYYSFSQNDTV